MKLGNLTSNFKVQFVVLCVLLSLAALFLKDANPNTFDAKLGIEFKGGVRIPVTLEKSVDPTTMDTVVDTIKQRVGAFGLSQAIVRPVGDREVLVEIPQADESAITSVKNILREQGKFEGIIDGKVAVSGEDVVAVGGANAESTPSSLRTAQWQLGFTVTKPAAERFAEAAKGKTEYPVYMFLDRPENASIIIEDDKYEPQVRKELDGALQKEGDEILLFTTKEVNSSLSQIATKHIVIISNTTAQNTGLVSQLQSVGFVFSGNSSEARRIVVKGDGEMQPSLAPGVTAQLSEWKAIGLLSAPLLSEGLANGYVSQFYSISGAASGSTLEEQEKFALAEIKQLKSVISGGKLPVSALVGSSFSVEPTLGSTFLYYSAIGLVLAVFVVSVLIGLRYKRFVLAIPIIITNACEVIILTAIVGTFGTLDLSAMAGIITLIGTGVNDQLIITDEMLRKQRGETREIEDDSISLGASKEKLAKAFAIIFTIAGVAIASMFPLLVSGIVEMSGFAVSAILGILVGIFITRPAFGVFIQALFEN